MCFCHSFSNIEELPADIFEDMPVLKSINVAGNKLESVPEGTWGKIWNQLEEVYLESMHILTALLRLK